MTVTLYKVLAGMFLSSSRERGEDLKGIFFSCEETRPAGAYIQRGIQPLVQFEFKFLPACVWFLSCQALFLHRCLTSLFFFPCGLEQTLGS